MLVPKARSLPKSGAPERLESPLRHKQCSLLPIFVNYGRRKFCNIGPQIDLKTSFGGDPHYLWRILECKYESKVRVIDETGFAI